MNKRRGKGGTGDSEMFQSASLSSLIYYTYYLTNTNQEVKSFYLIINVSHYELGFIIEVRLWYINDLYINMFAMWTTQHFWEHLYGEWTFGPAAAVAKALLFSSDSCSFCGWFVPAHTMNSRQLLICFDSFNELNFRSTVNKKKQDS